MPLARLPATSPVSLETGTRERASHSLPNPESPCDPAPEDTVTTAELSPSSLPTPAIAPHRGNQGEEALHSGHNVHDISKDICFYHDPASNKTCPDQRCPRQRLDTK